jgi:hypothetical protein
VIPNKVLYEAFLPFQDKDVVVWTTKQNGPQEMYVRRVWLGGVDVKDSKRSCVITTVPFNQIEKIRELV